VAPFVRAQLLRQLRIPVDVEIAALGMASSEERVESGALRLRDFLRAFPVSVR
jgi:hypothetical protein